MEEDIDVTIRRDAPAEVEVRRRRTGSREP
jgi:hypothetical protein